ncbi:hypothetical protein NX794_30660 [Streptomyces sp. LP11]|uniref:Secreted protein n=1 Tax=Streptomyces pyxinicus TaxID=2970331 RepID=A0ABT2BAJ7_9ACTN|nr:hypothetical protein [Streptomyces sp. LP11]MCS0605533.1 hypothetical protein [Streptomyces sp. LP11]
MVLLALLVPVLLMLVVFALDAYENLLFPPPPPPPAELDPLGPDPSEN